MSVSGSGNVSPGSGNIDPSLFRRTTGESSVGRKSSLTSESTSTAAEKQEGLVQSGAAASYGTETNINEAKYRETQRKSSSSPKSRLKGPFSRVKAGVQGFLKGFGSRASRVSARNAEARGEGVSMIPTEISMTPKKNRVSPEMQRFYLDAVSMGGSSSDVSMLSFDSLKSSDLRTPLLLEGNLSASEVSSTASFGSFQKAASFEESSNLCSVARLGGEAISTLLDPNIETSSLVRRAALTTNEGMIDLEDLENALASTSMETLATPLSSKGDFSAQSVDTDVVENKPGMDMGVSSSGVIEDNAKAQEKKESQKQLQEDQEMLARAMAGLLMKSQYGDVYVPETSSSWSSPSTRFPPPKISGTIAHPSSSKAKKTSFFGNLESHRTFSSSGGSQKASMDIPFTPSQSSEGGYRFPIARDSSWFPEDSEPSSTEFHLPESSSKNLTSIPREGIPRAVESGIGGALGNDAVSSSYQFDSFSGFSALAPLPRSTQEYKHLLEHYKGPGGPPDPLIYQYRNVAVEPPIILRPPQPYGGSASRFVVQGKPEASSVHDDGGSASDQGKRDEDFFIEMFSEEEESGKTSTDIGS